MFSMIVQDDGTVTVVSGSKTLTYKVTASFSRSIERLFNGPSDSDLTIRLRNNRGGMASLAELKVVERPMTVRERQKFAEAFWASHSQDLM